MDSARHFRGCLSTAETRAQNAFNDVASTMHQSLRSPAAPSPRPSAARPAAAARPTTAAAKEAAVARHGGGGAVQQRLQPHEQVVRRAQPRAAAPQVEIESKV